MKIKLRQDILMCIDLGMKSGAILDAVPAAVGKGYSWIAQSPVDANETVKVFAYEAHEIKEDENEKS